MASRFAGLVLSSPAMAALPTLRTGRERGLLPHLRIALALLGAPACFGALSDGAAYLDLPSPPDTFHMAEYAVDVWQTEHGLPQNPVTSIAQGRVTKIVNDGDGKVWFKQAQKLACFQADRFVVLKSPDEEREAVVNVVCPAAAGGVWLGSYAGIVTRYDHRVLTPYSAKEGMEAGSVWALLEAPDGTLWVGGSNGLSRLKEDRFTHYGVEQGLPVKSIGSIVEDDAGRLWLGSHQGILRVAKPELTEFAQGRRGAITWVVYTRAGGLASVDCGGGLQPACWRGRDGRLWFGTTKGAVVVDPARLSVNLQPPPVAIEQLLIDDHEVAVSWPATSGSPSSTLAGTGLGRTTRPLAPAAEESAIRQGNLKCVRIRPGQNRLEIRYAGLSLVAPEKVRFKYRLAGWDTDWVDAGTRRVASYTRVAPGEYQFRVCACNNDGVWNETGAALGVIVLAPWYRTWWAYALGGLLAAGIVLGSYEVRLHRLRRARALQADFSRRLIDSQEADRKRMAKELHDGLGQDLILIKNRAELGLRRLDPPEPLAEQLREISDAATAAIEEVRATARALHPYELGRLGLTHALDAMARRAGETSPTKFLTDLDKVDGLFPPETQINLYRLLQEGVSNVLKHARATEVILEIKREGDGVRATVLDDGCGFDPATLGATGRGGLGLQSMAERAGLIGGKLQVQSAPGRGTRLEVTIPLPSSTYG